MATLVSVTGDTEFWDWLLPRIRERMSLRRLETKYLCPRLHAVDDDSIIVRLHEDLVPVLMRCLEDEALHGGDLDAENEDREEDS